MSSSTNYWYSYRRCTFFIQCLYTFMNLSDSFFVCHAKMLRHSSFVASILWTFKVHSKVHSKVFEFTPFLKLDIPIFEGPISPCTLEKKNRKKIVPWKIGITFHNKLESLYHCRWILHCEPMIFSFIEYIKWKNWVSMDLSL
jgi:hypothetical protein